MNDLDKKVLRELCSFISYYHPNCFKNIIEDTKNYNYTNVQIKSRCIGDIQCMVQSFKTSHEGITFLQDLVNKKIVKVYKPYHSIDGTASIPFSIDFFAVALENLIKYVQDNVNK